LDEASFEKLKIGAFIWPETFLPALWYRTSFFTAFSDTSTLYGRHGHHHFRSRKMDGKFDFSTWPICILATVFVPFFGKRTIIINSSENLIYVCVDGNNVESISMA
jgi:hypothetical protein